MGKKIILILIISALVILIVGGYFYFQNWWAVKQIKIEKGLASDKFPWRDYTQEELAKMYPQIKYADVPTRVTPEETYAKFREALRTNNLEMAIEQLFTENRRYQKNKEILEKAYNEGRIQAMYEEYPEKIEKSWMGDNFADYHYLKKEGEYNLRQTINFIKDANGDWKLGSL